jgi:hypothetical protein
MRVYVAGPLNPTKCEDRASEYLDNVRNMIDASIKLLRAGHSPYCPALVYQYLVTEPVPISMIIKSNFDFLDCCDAILLTGDWENSVGSVKESQRAIELGIPIYTRINDLLGEKR